jgi:putative ABC transport system permease protein
MANLWQDLRYAGRTIRRAPAFTLLAIVTIAIGVGANAAIFSVVNAILLRPLPYPRADELVIVAQGNRVTKQSGNDATPANFLEWRTRNRSFAGLAAFVETRPTVAFGETPERINGSQVSANFFDVLGVRAAIGRTFQPADDPLGAPRVAVIGDGLWRDRFAAAPDIVGRTLRINNELHTIVGVLPPGIDYPSKAQVWFSTHWRVPDDPLLSPADDPSAQRSHGYFSAVGRFKPGVTFDAAVADMDRVAIELERDYPTANQNLGSFLVPLRDDLVADVRSTTLLLFAAVGLLLLIATANVSGLLMARATARQQEISVRAALGATRSRIIAQLLTESVLLALAGGVAGTLLAMWLVAPLVALSPADLTVAGDVQIDRRVLLFCLGVSGLAGVLFGLAPARQLSRADIHDELKQSARGTVGARHRRVRAILVAGEIALSLVLLVAAGLTVRSFIRVQQVPIGFNPDHVLTLTVSPPSSRYNTQALRADFWERLAFGLRRVPGVEIAGAISRLPLLPGNSTRGIAVKDLPANVAASAHYRTANPDYFRAMGIPILGGRAFTDADRDGRPRTAIISHAAAQRFWPGRNPIGETFQIDVPGPEITIVGIAGDVRSASLESTPPPTIYVPYRQDAFPFMTFVLKTSAPAGALTPAVRAVVAQVDRDIPVPALRTMDEQLSNSLTRRRFSVTLLIAFGVTAVVLAAVGLYGVLAFIVSQRRREIGVRIALGATARNIVTDVLGQGLRLAALGMALGLALALATTRVMAALLFGTSPTDVATYAGAATLLTIVAIAASLIPAVRASRVDPLKALRDE